MRRFARSWEAKKTFKTESDTEEEEQSRKSSQVKKKVKIEGNSKVELQGGQSSRFDIEVKVGTVRSSSHSALEESIVLNGKVRELHEKCRSR